MLSGLSPVRIFRCHRANVYDPLGYRVITRPQAFRYVTISSVGELLMYRAIGSVIVIARAVVSAS